jgi:hypothetical protein
MLGSEEENFETGETKKLCKTLKLLQAKNFNNDTYGVEVKNG